MFLNIYIPISLGEVVCSIVEIDFTPPTANTLLSYVVMITKFEEKISFNSILFGG